MPKKKERRQDYNGYVSFDDLLIYGLLPHEGDGLNIAEIHDRLKELNVCLPTLVFQEIRFVLGRLIEQGLVERIETPDGEKRYRKKLARFKHHLKICLYCGSPFYARDIRRKFCTNACRVNYHRQHCEKCRQRSLEWVKKRFGTKTHHRDQQVTQKQPAKRPIFCPFCGTALSYDPELGFKVCKRHSEYFWIELNGDTLKTVKKLHLCPAKSLDAEFDNCGGLIIWNGNDGVCRHCGLKFRLVVNESASRSD